MRRNRKTKILMITALCVAVIGLTLGFAAFANQLTISSSATVSPDESDFKLVVYGNTKEGLSNHEEAENYMTETTQSQPVIVQGGDFVKANAATIKTAAGNKIEISAISATLTDIHQEVEWIFKIKNESPYDAYLNLQQMQLTNFIGTPRECTAIGDTQQALVNEACKSIIQHTEILDSNFDNLLLYDESSSKFENIKIEKSQYIYINIRITYSEKQYGETDIPSEKADGDFSVDFEPITLDFSTVA